MLFWLGVFFLYFVQGLIVGSWIGYFSALLVLGAYIFLTQVFQVLWSIKPLMAIVIEKRRWVVLVAPFVMIASVLLISESNLWFLLPAIVIMGALDVTIDGFVTINVNRGVRPSIANLVAGIGNFSGLFVSYVFLKSGSIILYLKVVSFLSLTVTFVALFKEYRKLGDVSINVDLGEVFAFMKRDLFFLIALWPTMGLSLAYTLLSVAITRIHEILVGIVLVGLGLIILTRLFGEKKTYVFSLALMVVSYVIYLSYGYLVPMVVIASSISYFLAGYVNIYANKANTPFLYTSILFAIATLFGALGLEILKELGLDVATIILLLLMAITNFAVVSNKQGD